MENYQIEEPVLLPEFEASGCPFCGADDDQPCEENCVGWEVVNAN